MTATRANTHHHLEQHALIASQANIHRYRQTHALTVAQASSRNPLAPCQNQTVLRALLGSSPHHPRLRAVILASRAHIFQTKQGHTQIRCVLTAAQASSQTHLGRHLNQRAWHVPSSRTHRQEAVAKGLVGATPEQLERTAAFAINVQRASSRRMPVTRRAGIATQASIRIDRERRQRPHAKHVLCCLTRRWGATVRRIAHATWAPRATTVGLVRAVRQANTKA